jgi:hypothetical protein
VSKQGKIRRRKETCSACKTRPVRAADQRYCKECHNEAVKKYNRSLREELLRYRAERNA